MVDFSVMAGGQLQGIAGPKYFETQPVAGNARQNRRDRRQGESISGRSTFSLHFSGMLSPAV
jgi:hypothetical protein